MKHGKLDAAIVAALLLAYIPGLAEKVLPEPTPQALLLPAPQAEDAPENPAERL